MSGIRVLALADHLGHRDGRVHGGTTYFLSVYPALVRAGVDLTVVFLAPPHSAAEKLREEGVEPIFLSRTKWDPRVVGDVRQLIRSRPFDVLHLASLRSHLLGRWFGHQLGLSSLIHIHDTVPLSPVMQFVQKRVRGRGDLAVVVSKPVAEIAKHDYGFDATNTRVLHNAIDVKSYSQPRPDARAKCCAQWGVDPKAKLIGIVGRLAEMKGHHYLFEAMPAILKAQPDAKAVVVGSGPWQDKIIAEVQNKGLSDKVIFVGQCDNMPEVFASLDVLAMPSISGEGLPFVAIEAIAAGLPIVGYPTAGIPDIVIHDQCGLLVPQREVQPLADAITRVLQDSALHERLKAGALQHAQQFTLDRHIARLLDLYTEAGKHHNAMPLTRSTA